MTRSAASQNVLAYSLVILCVIITGHHCPGPEGERALPLAAIVLSNSLYNVTGLSVIIGLASALETYCGYAHANGGGTRARHLMNGYLVRGTLVCLVAGECTLNGPTAQRRRGHGD